MSKKLKKNKDKTKKIVKIYRRSSDNWKVAYVIIKKVDGNHSVKMKIIGYTQIAIDESATIRLGTTLYIDLGLLQLMLPAEKKLIVKWTPKSEWQTNTDYHE